MSAEQQIRKPRILPPELVLACLEGTHIAGQDGRPIPTAGHQLLASHERLVKEHDELRRALELADDLAHSYRSMLGRDNKFDAYMDARRAWFSAWGTP